MPDAIDPSQIPGAGIDPDIIESNAGTIATNAAAVRDNGSQVHLKWQAMSGVYSAPESGTLLGLMQPVSSQATMAGDNLETVAAALRDFAAEVRPIKAELDALRVQAQAFVDTTVANGARVRELNPAWVNMQSTYGGLTTPEYSSSSTGGTATASDTPQYRYVTKEWHEDQDSVDRNNELLGAVNAQQVLLWEAERACANKIRALYGADPLHAAQSADDALGYGLDEVPEGTEMPWGAPVERTEGCVEASARFVFEDFLWKGIVVGGVWGTIQGLGTLVLGYDPASGQFFQGDAYGAAWGNLGMLGVAALTNTGVLAPIFQADAASQALGGGGFLPQEVRDFKAKADETAINTGKALIAWDKWQDDPGTALGESVFNVATIVIPGGAAVAGVKTAGTAASVLSRMARFADLVDPGAWAVNGATRVGGFAFTGIDNLIGKTDFAGRFANGVSNGFPEVWHGTDAVSALDELIDVRGIPAEQITVNVVDGVPVIDAPGIRVELPAGAFDAPAVRVDDAAGGVREPAVVREPELVGAGVRAEGGSTVVNSIVDDAPVRTETTGSSDSTVVRDSDTTTGSGSGGSGHGGGSDAGGGSGGGGSNNGIEQADSGEDISGGAGDGVGNGVASADAGDAALRVGQEPPVAVGEPLTHFELERLADDGYHVAFFDRSSFNNYYDIPSPTLGPPGGKFWVMPLEDGAFVRNASDAYRATGAAPAATRSFLGYEIDAHGIPDLSRPVPAADRGLMAIIFRPDDVNAPAKPNAADAGGWPHYLDTPDPRAGHTAVLTGDGPSAAYLTNSHIREFVIDGGDQVYSGSMIARIEDGRWIVERVY